MKQNTQNNQTVHYGHAKEELDGLLPPRLTCGFVFIIDLLSLWINFLGPFLLELVGFGLAPAGLGVDLTHINTTGTHTLVVINTLEKRGVSEGEREAGWGEGRD